MTNKTCKNFSVEIARLETLLQIIKYPIRLFLSFLSKKHIKNNNQLAIFSFDHISHDINLDGLYEKDYLMTLIKWLEDYKPSVFEGSVIDAGANIGNHSIFFSKFFKHVYSFEPNKLTYKLLAINTELIKNVTTKNIGLSNKKKNAKLLVNKINIGGSSIVDFNTNNTSLIKLSSADNEINFDEAITLFKIDVEGHELEVLQGSKKLIDHYRPIIIFEQQVADFESKFYKIKDLLGRYKYSNFGIIRRGSSFSSLKPKWFGKYLYRLLCIITKEQIFISFSNDIPPDNYHFIIGIPDNDSNAK